ncbi:primosomal protein N' [Candidatus Saganbacteria bacterium]|nr:primosomal protein N' [Candidatus Saganbacteria bacterium]
MLAEIVLSKTLPKLDKIYHYEIPGTLSSTIKLGHQVQVPFGNSNRIGYVVGFAEKSDFPNLKIITSLVSENPVFTENGLKLAKFISKYYNCFFTTALRAILPPSVKKKEVGKKVRVKKPGLLLGEENSAKNPISLPLNNTGILPLTQSQQLAINTIKESLCKQKGETFLLHGPTGTGKTEVYLKVVEEAFKNGQGSIVLVPEIGLMPQLVKSFKERFYDSVSIIHSGLTDKERNFEWEKIINGSSKIVIGTRVAIFAPVKNLKVLILDEEYETTYKSEQNPRYHARTIAEFLSKNAGIVSVLGSATPSIEAYFKAQTGQYKLLELIEKINTNPLPLIEIIDMREQKKGLLSQTLKKEIKETLERGEKVILFLNRRGFFTYAMCRECGFTIQCPTCAVSLIYHYKSNQLVCGHCGFTSGINLVCPKCQNSSIAFLGIGTQRIEEEVGEVFCKAKIVRIDRDSVTKKGSHEELFAAFSEGGANVLIGTQLVTKGIDIPKVTLVGVVSADSMLNVPDFRAAEHTFEQLVQVAGRSGRYNPGKVIIQTWNPDHYAIKFASKLDYKGFYDEEIKNREGLSYPPFSELINIIIHGHDEQKVIKVSNDLKRFLQSRDPGSGKLGYYQILGPVAASIAKIRGEYRWQILLKGKNLEVMRNAIKESTSKIIAPYEIRITIDIEPMNLL